MEPLAQQSVQQNRCDAGMAQDRSNQLALPVEADGPPNQALNVVGHESAEQLVDLVVRQLGEETTDTAIDDHDAFFGGAGRASDEVLVRLLASRLRLLPERVRNDA